jgi:glutamate-1-semialdehyde 2,1-aminomutase
MDETPLERYRRLTPGSAAAGARAERVMPGGDTRAAGFHAPYPLTLERGDGARVLDVDGRAYWDLLGNFTSLVHGHGYPPIVEAVQRQLGQGTAWPARNPHQIELAELLVERVASVESVRFTNSGTEAAMLALNAARVVTGRGGVLMARFGYHGSYEAFEVGSFDGRFHLPGATRAWLAPYGDADAFEEEIHRHGPDLAAVFLEPVLGSAGVVEATPGFFRRVHDACRAVGALLVVDEVITFRLATGGRQAALGVTPDLTLFGKLIGGGFPVGAVGGRADVMAVMDPRQGRMFHSGTFNGNPVTAAAGVVSVRELTAERIDGMGELTARLDRTLHDQARSLGLAFTTRRVGSMLNVYLSDTAPEASIVRDDEELIGSFHLAAMNHGLYFASRGLIALSTVITEDDLTDIEQRFGAALADVAGLREPAPAKA